MDGFGVYTSPHSTAYVSLALALYDTARQSAQANCSLTVGSGAATLLTHTFAGTPSSGASPSDGLEARLANAAATSVTAWSALASPPEPLRLRAVGQGELSVAAALVFVPASTPSSPMYRCGAGLGCLALIQSVWCQCVCVGGGVGGGWLVASRPACVACPSLTSSHVLTTPANAPASTLSPPCSRGPRGFYVQRVIQRQNETSGGPTGPLLQNVERGAVVVVTIQITTPDAVSNVLVNALMPGGVVHCRVPPHPLPVPLLWFVGLVCRPTHAHAFTRASTPCRPNLAPHRAHTNAHAGLEPMDPLLVADPHGNVGPGYCGDLGGMTSLWRWCYPSFRQPQVMKDRVLWTAPYLYPGTHTLTFNALAVTRGTSCDAYPCPCFSPPQPPPQTLMHTLPREEIGYERCDPVPAVLQACSSCPL